jgi:hypothetical protein
MAGTNNRAAGTFENETATETTAEVRGDKIAVVVLGDVESNPISLEREAAGDVWDVVMVYSAAGYFMYDFPGNYRLAAPIIQADEEVDFVLIGSIGHL